MKLAVKKRAPAKKAVRKIGKTSLAADVAALNRRIKTKGKRKK